MIMAISLQPFTFLVKDARPRGAVIPHKPLHRLHVRRAEVAVQVCAAVHPLHVPLSLRLEPGESEFENPQLGAVLEEQPGRYGDLRAR